MTKLLIFQRPSFKNPNKSITNINLIVYRYFILIEYFISYHYNTLTGLFLLKIPKYRMHGIIMIKVFACSVLFDREQNVAILFKTYIINIMYCK